MKGQPSGHSCWQKNGKEIPFTPYKTRKFNIMKEMKKADKYNLLSINSDKKTVSESVISIEKANGPILIFSTKADNVWPSAESGEKLIERLKANNFQYPFKHICFERMCHIMMENANGMTKLISKSEKKYPAECAEERKSMEKETLNWIENVW